MNRRISVVVAALFTVALNGCAASRTGTGSSLDFGAEADISARKAQEILDADTEVIYLDVRTVAEFDEGRPVGAYNIPYLVYDADGKRTVNSDFLSVVQANFEKDDRLVVGCRSGGRSKMAQEVLEGAGFTNVVNMLGGFGGKKNPDGTLKHQGWSQEGFETESGSESQRSYVALKAKAEK